MFAKLGTVSVLIATIFVMAFFGTVAVSAQSPTPTPEKKMEMPTPTPAPSHKDHKMEMPSPTPTPAANDDATQKTHKTHKMDTQMDGANPKADPTPEEKRSPVVLPDPGPDFPKPIEDSANYSLVLVELLEYDASAADKNSLTWDMIGWYGGDYNRLWFRSEGEISQSSKAAGDVEFQALYGRMIAPFYDVQVGLRYDQQWKGSERNSRFHAVVGLTGLVPYEYEVEPLMFISDKGDVSFRFTGVKDIFLNQRTIFEGRFEANAAVQKVESFGVGTGLNDMQFGIRIRREINREFAPYVGVTYKRLFGQTADFARLENERVDRLSFVAGVRMWF